MGRTVWDSSHFWPWGSGEVSWSRCLWNRVWGNEWKSDRCVGKVGHFSRPREAARAMGRTLRTCDGLGQLEKGEGSGKGFSGQNSLALLAPGHR